MAEETIRARLLRAIAHEPGLTAPKLAADIAETPRLSSVRATLSTLTTSGVIRREIDAGGVAHYYPIAPAEEERQAWQLRTIETPDLQTAHLLLRVRAERRDNGAQNGVKVIELDESGLVIGLRLRNVNTYVTGPELDKYLLWVQLQHPELTEPAPPPPERCGCGSLICPDCKRCTYGGCACARPEPAERFPKPIEERAEELLREHHARLQRTDPELAPEERDGLLFSPEERKQIRRLLRLALPLLALLEAAERP